MRKFKCEKCEYGDIAVIHRPLQEVISFEPKRIIEERLLCTCNRCKFIWQEEPSNKDKQ